MGNVFAVNLKSMGTVSYRCFLDNRCLYLPNLFGCIIFFSSFSFWKKNHLPLGKATWLTTYDRFSQFSLFTQNFTIRINGRWLSSPGKKILCFFNTPPMKAVYKVCPFKPDRFQLDSVLKYCWLLFVFVLLLTLALLSTVELHCNRFAVKKKKENDPF